MGKIKTHSGAKKRFSLTKNGKIKAKKAFARHILTKKSSKRKRNFRKASMLEGKTGENIKKLIPYA